MNNIVSHNIWVHNPNLDPFKATWKLEKETPGLAANTTDRLYSKSHTWIWQVGQGLSFAIQMIFTLGLALISKATRRTWQEMKSGKEWAICHIQNYRITPPGPKPPVQPPPKRPKGQYAKPFPMTPNPAFQSVKVGEMNLTSFKPADAKLFNEIELAFQIIDKLEESVGRELDKTKCKQHIPIGDVVDTFDKIIKEYQRDYYRKIDGFRNGDERLFGLELGNTVPPYNANVNNDGSTGYSRRYRALVGMRNLVFWGADILCELNENLFTPNPTAYGYKGLARMLDLTGNTVDLEWPLNATDDSTAKAQARKLIPEFKRRFCHPWSATAMQTRNLDNWPHVVYTSQTNNTDRGLYPVWKRVNPSTNKVEYYANVPNISVVVSALLRGPLLFAQSYLIMKNLGEPLASLFDDNSLSMKCFNDKLEKAVEFNEKQKNLIRATPESIASAQYGKAAVKSALTADDIAEFLEDDQLLPPINKGATEDYLKAKNYKRPDWVKTKENKLDEWIKATDAQYKQNERALINKLANDFFPKIAKVGWSRALYFDGTTYRPFDKLILTDHIEKMIRMERGDSANGFVDHIRFL